MFKQIIGSAPLLIPRDRVSIAVEYAFGSNPFAWAAHRQYRKGGNVFEDIGNSVVSFVKDPISYTGDRLAEIDKTVLQPINREVIQPVGRALEKIGQGIAKDPVTFLAQVAAVAAAPFTAGQSLWALPVIAAASTAAHGGTLEQVLTATAVSAATAYVGANASGWIMSGLSQASAAGPSFALAGTPIAFSTAQTIAQVGTGLSVAAISATGAAIQGKDPLRAAIPALVGTAAGVAVDQLAATDAFKDLSASINSVGKNVSPVVANAIKGVASAAITGAIQGKDATGAIAGVLASSVVTGLTSTVDVVSDFFKDNTGNISKFGSATQGLIANLAASVVANATSGGKAGAAYTGALMESLAKVLGTGVGAAYDSLATTVQGLYTGASKAADTLNTAAEKQNTIRETYNSKVTVYGKKLNALDDLYAQEKDLITKYDAANDQATVDKLAKEISTVQSNIKSTVKEMNLLYDDIEKYRAYYSDAQYETSKAQEAYFAKAKELGTNADLLTNQTNDLAKKLNKELVSELDPSFNEVEYKAINNLGAGVDAYTHWLSVGKNNGLATNYEAAQGAVDLEKSRLVNDIAKAQGYESVLQMSPSQYKAAMAKVDAIYGNNLAQLKDATTTNITQYATAYGVKTLDNVLGKYDAAKAGQYTMEDLKIGMSGWNAAGNNYTVPDGYKLATQEEVARGLAKVTYDDNGKPVWLSSNGQDITTQYNAKTGEVESRGVLVGTGKSTYEYDKDTKQWVEVAAPTEITIYGGAYKADNLNTIDGFTQLYSLAGMNESALVVNMGEAASKLGIGAAKTIIEVAQSTGNSTLINTAANVVKAGGGFLQSLAGLSVLAGYAPGSTAFGKFSNALVELGKAGNTAEYTAAIKNIQNLVGNAKGVGGTLDAIWTGFKSAPAEFLAEYIGVEGFQEVAPFLIGAGASTFAKGAAIAKGMGEKFAAEYGAKMGIKAAAMSDIAESVGGAADGAFTEAYKVAKSKGMSDAQATQTALSIATSTGIVSGLLTAGSMGIGGLAMEKALIGSGTASGLMGKAIDNLVNFAATGGKITIKEGLSEAGEEGLTQAFLEGQLYKLDPNRDVAANITAAAAFGAIAGGPIAGGTYALSEGTNLVANTLMANPTVAKIVSEAKNTAAGAATAATLLTGLGITGPAQADILDKVYDAGYTSTAEAAAILKTYDNFNPSQTDINALTGNIADTALKAKADAYVNPLVTSFDEAKSMLAGLGYKPTDAEVQQFVGQIAETKSKTDTATYADTHTVTAAEAKKYLTDLGYNPTTAEINQFVFSGQGINQDTVKTDAAKYADTHTVTTAEAKKYFESLGYKPTAADIAAFTKQGADIDETAFLKTIDPYVDPRQVTNKEAEEILKKAGYKNPTEEEISKFIGQGLTPVGLSDKNFQTSIVNKAAQYAKQHTVTADDVRNWFATEYFSGAGYSTPSIDEVNKFVQQGADVDKFAVQKQAVEYADKIITTPEEAAQFFKDLGYTPSKEELASYTGRVVQGDKALTESEVKNAVSGYVDPRYTDVEEVIAAALKEGYKITEEEAKKFIGQFEEAKKLAEVTGYADPLAVLESEAAKYFSDLKYVPTKEELAAYIGQKKEADVATAISKYVDPRYATAAEVKAAALKEGYTLSDEEAASFVGQKDQVTQEAAARAYADPLAVLAEEAKSYFAQEGYTPTVEELQKYTGIRNEADTAKLIYAYADPLAMTEAEARKYMADLGYTQPTASEVSQFVKQAKEADVQKALTTYVDTHQVTQAEVDAFVKQIGYVPSKDELKSYVQQGATTDQQKVMDLLSEYVDPRYVTADEVKAAYDALGLKTPTDADIQKFVGQYAESELAGKTKDYLPIATYNLTQQDIANSQKTVLDKMAEYEKVGLSRDQALDKAIGDVATNLGKTKTEIMGIIGTPAVADNPNTPANEAKPATGIYKTIGDVQSGLETKIGGVQADLAATKKSILDQVALYEQAGIDRDTALSLSIAGVAQDLGTTKTDLLSKIGTTETALKADIAGVKAKLSQDIQTVADLVGKPVQLVTQEDLDYVNNILNIKEGQTQPAINLAYDVNRDGKIDTTDQMILQNQLKVQQGTNIETKVDPNTGIETKIDTTTGKVIESWNPQTGSKWASTGIYEQLNRQQADSDLKAKAAAATAAKNLDVAKKQSNFNTLLGMVMSAPDVGGQKVTVQQAPLTEIKNIYDWSSIFATPQQASLFPSPYGQVNVFGQSPQAQPGIAGLGALGGQQQQFKFAEGGMIGGDIEVGSGGNVDDLLNILKGNSG